MESTFWALIPPILAIIISLITKEVNLSLIIGIVVGCGLYCGFNPFITVTTIVAALCLCIALPIFLAAISNKFSILDKKIPQHFGKISYPLYLIHQNIAYTIIYHLLKISSVYMWLWKFVSFITVIILGEGLFWAVERPMQRFIHT